MVEEREGAVVVNGGRDDNSRGLRRRSETKVLAEIRCVVGFSRSLLGSVKYDGRTSLRGSPKGRVFITVVSGLTN